MSIFEPSTFRISMWPVLAMIRITPLTNLKAKFVRRILNALMLSFFTSFTYICRDSVRTILSDYIPVFWMDRMTLMSMLFIWTWELKGANLIENIILEVTEIDDELKRFGVELTYRKFMFGQLTTILICLIIFFFVTNAKFIIWLFADMRVSSLPNWGTIISFLRNLQQIFILINILVVMSVLEALFVRFKFANQIIEDVDKSDKKNEEYIFITTRGSLRCTNDLGNRTNHLSSRILMDKVDRVCRIHRRLTKMSKDLSKTFSLILLGTFICDLFQLMLDRVRFTTIITSRDRNYLELISTIIGAICTASKLWYIIRQCSKVCDEANKIGSSLFKVPTHDPVVLEQFHRHSIYFIQTRLRLTAGIFTMDRALASAILYNSLQFAIVLIQFNNDENAA